MNVPDKILNLAKKLKALSEKGIGGEKDNATSMLKIHMDKHGITWEMLGEDLIKDHEVFLSEDQERFYKQICANVCGIGSCKFGRYAYKMGKNPGKNRFYVECTDVEFIEISARFDFFWPHYKEESDIFYSAFIQSNKLYAKPSGDESEQKELTRSEKERLLKMMAMMSGMEPKQYLKQLSVNPAPQA